MATKAMPTAIGWALEVIRGREIGRRYALPGSALVLGNALGSDPGINLAEQETSTLRRMAGQHAEIQPQGDRLAIRDLESPGGTFVNRQRLLAGTWRTLNEGDQIQLGGVQLRVVTDRAAPSRTTPPPIPPPVPSPTRVDRSDRPFAYNLRSGSVCRNWDDFLVVAAQRWEELREDLVTGRLATFLRSIGRDDLAPRPSPGLSEDEQLDDWLGRLPTTRDAKAELDVHPRRLEVRSPAVGTTRQTIRVANIGHRLLRWSARVEPSGTSWLRIAPEFAGKPTTTVIGTDLILEVEPPADLTTPQTATIAFESNGGNSRVEVALVRREARPSDLISPEPSLETGWGLSEWLADRGLASRAVGLVAAMAAIRLLVAFFEAIPIIPVGEGPGLETPSLARPAAGFAALGCLAGLVFALRRGQPRDQPTSGFAGAFAGLIVATAAVALARTLEGSTFGDELALVPWIILGLILALISIVVVPHREGQEGSP